MRRSVTEVQACVKRQTRAYCTHHACSESEGAQAMLSAKIATGKAIVIRVESLGTWDFGSSG